MSDKKAEGFEEWFNEQYGFYDKSNLKESKWVNKTIKPLVKIPWDYLTEKHEKEMEKALHSKKAWDNSRAKHGLLLQAANKKLELLTKCRIIIKDMKNRTTCICQGCKNKQLIDNEFSGGE